MELNERREMIKDVIRHDMKAYSKDQLYSELFDFLVDVGNYTSTGNYDQGILHRLESLIDQGLQADEESLIDHWEEATGKTYPLPDKNAEWENNGFASEADFWKYKEG